VILVDTMLPVVFLLPVPPGAAIVVMSLLQSEVLLPELVRRALGTTTVLPPVLGQSCTLHFGSRSIDSSLRRQVCLECLDLCFLESRWWQLPVRCLQSAILELSSEGCRMYPELEPETPETPETPEYRGTRVITYPLTPLTAAGSEVDLYASYFL